MSWFSRRAPILGVLAFAVVWAGGALYLVRSDDEVVGSPVAVSTESFPPGTITPGPPREEDCGDIEGPARFMDVVDEYPAEFECMSDAFDAGRPAVLVVRGRTSDDRPIRMQVRVAASNRLVIYFDDTRDPSGDGLIRRFECTGIDPVTHAPTGCASA